MTPKVDVPTGLICGEVDQGYGPVADAFRRNFAERGEVRAACAVYRDGKRVVDLWGGYRDGVRRAAWLEGTVVVMRGVTVDGADIDAPWLLDGDGSLLVNGVDVAPLVEAELNRRFPGRANRRAGDPGGLREAWAALERT